MLKLFHPSLFIRLYITSSSVDLCSFTISYMLCNNIPKIKLNKREDKVTFSYQPNLEDLLHLIVGLEFAMG